MNSELYHLSLQQARVWKQWEREVATPFSRARFLIEGSIDVESLRARLSFLARNYEILRTRYTVPKGAEIPCQCVEPLTDLQLQMVDLTHLPPNEQEAAARQLFVDTPSWIKPMHGPVLGGRLIRMADQQYNLCLYGATLALDDASLIEIAKFMVNGGQPSPVTNPLQYPDFVAWQTEMEQCSSVETPRGFSLLLSGGAAPTRELILGIHERTGTYRPATVERRTPRQPLQQFCSGASVSEETLLLSVWLAVLQRLNSGDPVTTGVFFPGRRMTELVDAMGLFAWYWPFIFAIDPGSNGTVLAREIAAALKHSGDCNPEAGGQVPGPARNGHKERFPYCFRCEQLPFFRFGGVCLKVLSVKSLIEPAVLACHCQLDEEATTLSLTYDESCCSNSQASTILDHFATMLTDLTVRPTIAVRQLRIVSTGERGRLLSHSRADKEGDTCAPCLFHSLFEAQAIRTPDRVAAEAGDAKVLYADLDRRANQLAHYLQSRGVGPEMFVGVCLPRQIDLIVALLGILKAGGAYVPMDPHYPIEQLRFIQQDSGFRLLITVPELGVQLTGTDWFCLDDLSPDTLPTHTPTTCVRPDNAAYLIYASGSIGGLKAAVIPHQVLAHYARWSAAAYRIDEGNGSLVHTSIASDSTVASLLSPLIVGQRVCLVPEKTGIGSLVDVMRTNCDWSLLKISSSHFGVLNEMLTLSKWDGGVRSVVTGCEALDAGTAASWREHSPQSRLINEYSPSEITVGCCIHEINEADDRGGAVFIGKPIPGAEVFLLDDDMEPVPVGVAGELYVGGFGLARSYWGRAEQTAARFVPNPFSNTAGHRLYRTGDFARYDFNGTMEYLGRSDAQMEVKGRRVELGEIEIRLRLFATVRKAVVRVSGDKLVAYIRSSNPRLTATELREYLKAHLPAHMIPAAYIFLDQFPLTEAGEIDWQSLPTGVRTKDLRACPRSTMEEKLAAIWKDVLQLQDLGIHDDLFDLGGHSLHATQIMTRVREQLQVAMPIRTVFENPTVALLARAVKRQEAMGAVPHRERNADLTAVQPPQVVVSSSGDHPRV